MRSPEASMRRECRTRRDFCGGSSGERYRRQGSCSPPTCLFDKPGRAAHLHAPPGPVLLPKKHQKRPSGQRPLRASAVSCGVTAGCAATLAAGAQGNDIGGRGVAPRPHAHLTNRAGQRTLMRRPARYRIAMLISAYLPSTLSAVAATFSPVKPNSLNSWPAGADAPK